MRALTPLAAACLLASVASCVSSSSNPTPASDSGTFDASVPDDSAAPGQDATVQDSATEDVALVDAVGACLATAVLADGACNDVQNADTTPVTGTCPAGSQPTGAGGTVVDGTYVLTAQARYTGDAGCTPATYEATMVIQGTCSQRVDVEGTATLYRNTTFETNGNLLTRTATCGAALPAATYTATPTTITIFDEGGSVTTWTKQ